MKGTVKAKDQVERLFQRGRRSSSYLVTVIALDRKDEAGRCAYIAGKKIGSAPVRNRCKRVLREAAREIGAPWEGKDVAFVARRAVAHEERGKLIRVLVKQLGEVGIHAAK